MRNIKLLQRAGFAPQLYATFNNGLAYEFAPGCTLDAALVRDPAVYPLVALRVAQLHAQSLENLLQDPEQQPRPILWDIMNKYTTLLKRAFADPDKKARCVLKTTADLFSLFACLIFFFECHNVLFFSFFKF